MIQQFEFSVKIDTGKVYQCFINAESSDSAIEKIKNKFSYLHIMKITHLWTYPAFTFNCEIE